MTKILPKNGRENVENHTTSSIEAMKLCCILLDDETYVIAEKKFFVINFIFQMFVAMSRKTSLSC